MNRNWRAVAEYAYVALVSSLLTGALVLFALGRLEDADDHVVCDTFEYEHTVICVDGRTGEVVSGG